MVHQSCTGDASEGDSRQQSSPLRCYPVPMVGGGEGQVITSGHVTVVGSVTESDQAKPLKAQRALLSRSGTSRWFTIIAVSALMAHHLEVTADSRAAPCGDVLC